MPDFSTTQALLNDPAMINAFEIFGVVAMTGVSIAAFIYMLGTMLANDKLKGWGKNEFLEIFYSAIVFSAIVFAVPTADGLLKGVLMPASAADDPITNQLCTISANSFPPQTPYYGVGSCHIRLAIYYLHSMFEEANNLAKMLYMRYLVTSVLADLSISVEFVFEMAGFFTYQSIRGLFTMGNYMTVQLFDWLIKMMTVTKFQEVFIVFIERGLFIYLLTAGAILRITAFTRRLGGLLIAMAIALFFVYPVFYAFGAVMINNIKVKIDPTVTLNTASSVSVVHKMYMNGTVPMIGGNLTLNPQLTQLTPEELKQKIESGRMMENTAANFDPFSGTGLTEEEIEREMEREMESGWKKVWNWFTGITNRALRDQLMAIAFEPGGPIDATARIAFFTGFIGFIAIMSTIAAIRSISIVVGGDIEIAGLTHLI